jgi:quinol monooxygenase YgiN
MTIKTIIELQAQVGNRDELVKIMDEVIETMREVPGFQGVSRYEVLDDPDKLIEIAEWASTEARQEWLDRSMASGVLKPLMEILGAPFKAVNVRQIT